MTIPGIYYTLTEIGEIKNFTTSANFGLLKAYILQHINQVNIQLHIHQWLNVTQNILDRLF